MGVGEEGVGTERGMVWWCVWGGRQVLVFVNVHVVEVVVCMYTSCHY